MMRRIAAWGVVAGLCFAVYAYGGGLFKNPFTALQTSPVAAQLPKLPPGCAEKAC